MQTLVLAVSLLASPAASSDATDLAAKAHELAQRFIIVDGHVDVPIRHYEERRDVSVSIPTDQGDFDYPRARAGGLDGPFMSIYTPSSLQDELGASKRFALDLIDYVNELAAKHPDEFMAAASVADVRAAKASGRIALLMGMENGSPIEDDVANVDLFHEKGIRYVTLCHATDNRICDSSYAETRTWRGLSPFGREVVARMNDVGIMVDVSHVSDDSFYQVMDLSIAPVVASHSSMRRFTPDFERNMSDDMARLMARKGGVVMINFGSSFLDGEFEKRSTAVREEMQRIAKERGLEGEALRAFRREYRESHPVAVVDVSVVADHIDHLVGLVGVDHVGFGSDFDGVGPTLPKGLEDVSKYPNLIRLLLERRYSEADIEKICSGNLLRVLGEVERIAKKEE